MIMNRKPKFITTHNPELTHLNQFNIELISQSTLNSSDFDQNQSNNYFFDLLDLVKQRTQIFKGSKWCFPRFESQYSLNMLPAILVERKNIELNNYITLQNTTDGYQGEYSIPMVTDLSRINDYINAFWFDYTQTYRDLDSLGSFDSLEFAFSEYYNTQQHFISNSDLEIIMKSMVENHLKSNSIFKFVSLYDSDFLARPAINEYENFYEETYQVYPHRQICAWKCIIKGNFSNTDIPQAAKVDNFLDGYTLVSTLDDHEYFSSYNPDHIYKANLVEIRLQELGVLPYFEIIETDSK